MNQLKTLKGAFQSWFASPPIIVAVNAKTPAPQRQNRNASSGESKGFLSPMDMRSAFPPATVAAALPTPIARLAVRAGTARMGAPFR
jgi:hypothetical protein